MIRIGFVMAYADQNWMGGINYLSNLLHAVMQLSDRRIEPVLIVPENTPDKILAGFPRVEVLRTPWVDHASPARFVRKALARLLNRDVLLERFLRRHRIEILSHSDHLGSRATLPTICWIPDFQHVRLPKFFQPGELVRRNRGYQDMARACSTPVLSSQDAQNDLRRFFPQALEKSQVLNFVSGMESGTQATGLEDLKSRYGISVPYLHLPNQFWAHKNHGVVVEALGLLKARGRSVRLVSTGHTGDVRQPHYFNDLMARAQALELSEEFRVLGLVPYADMMGLMTHAAAVVNPSLFEGWSTTVEESKSMGKTVVLSDIPVHREQAPEHGVYFDPGNAGQLADAIESVLARVEPDEEAARAGHAKAALRQRFIDFGRRYQDIALATRHARVKRGLP